MRYNLKACARLILGVCCLTLGFNTLDAMVWHFYYEPWLTWFPYVWAWAPNVTAPVWLSYFLGGILPFGLGAFLTGYSIKERLTQ